MELLDGVRQGGRYGTISPKLSYWGPVSGVLLEMAVGDSKARWWTAGSMVVAVICCKANCEFGTKSSKQSHYNSFQDWV